MNKFASLLNATMAGGIQLFRYRGKTERSRRIVPVLLGAFIGLSMMMSASAMIVELKGDGLDSSVVLSIYTLLTAIIIVTEGVYKSGDLLFRPRDNDMLLAMPIPKSTIVAVRMVKFYLFELVYFILSGGCDYDATGADNTNRDFLSCRTVYFGVFGEV